MYAGAHGGVGRNESGVAGRVEGEGTGESTSKDQDALPAPTKTIQANFRLAARRHKLDLPAAETVVDEDDRLSLKLPGQREFVLTPQTQTRIEIRNFLFALANQGIDLLIVVAALFCTLIKTAHASQQSD